MMADTDTGRTLTTKVISPIQSYDPGTRSLHEDVGSLSRERTSSAGQGVRERGGEQESAQPKAIVVIEQWICVILGLVCMVFGIWGIYMKPEQDALSAYTAWLGSLYMPTLRVTAVACIGLGVALARRGLGASMIGFRFPAAEDYCDLLAGPGTRYFRVSAPEYKLSSYQDTECSL